MDAYEVHALASRQVALKLDWLLCEDCHFFNYRLTCSMNPETAVTCTCGHFYFCSDVQSKPYVPCNTAMDKSNPKVMDAAFSDTRDCLVSRGEQLNVSMHNIWQYSSFSSNLWGQLDALSSFKSSFQSKEHLLNDPANTSERTPFPSNKNWWWTNGAIPAANNLRIRGLLSTASSESCNNRGSLVLSCCKSEHSWHSREAVNQSTVSGSIP